MSDEIDSLRADDETDFDYLRYKYLSSKSELSENEAAALVLAEYGYSHTGIASKVGVTETTAGDYLDRIADKFGKEVLETHPKHSPCEELWPEGDYEDPTIDN